MEAVKYRKFNEFQNQTASELLDQILVENEDKKFETVLDIGCGTGNITIELSNKLNNPIIIGFDISDDMIQYCLTNSKQNNINYITQDIGVHWNHLKYEIRKLRGQVSLGYSNLVFHWIENKAMAANNMVKLLANDGVIYACIATLPSPVTESEDDNQLLEQIYSIPTVEQQKQNWVQLFRGLGCSVTTSESKFHEIFIEQQLIDQTFSGMASFVYQQYLTEKDTKTKQSLISDNLYIISKGLQNAYNLRNTVVNDEQIFYFSIEYFFLIVKKFGE